MDERGAMLCPARIQAVRAVDSKGDMRRRNSSRLL